MRIYLDTCCLNRPFDDQSQARVHDESEAILSIINRSRNVGNILVGSAIVLLEIEQIVDIDKRDKILALYACIDEEIEYNETIKKKAAIIQGDASIQSLDSLHLASAEYGYVDIFLTTDDKLVKSCKNLNLSMRVMNPVSYLAEVIEDA